MGIEDRRRGAGQGGAGVGDDVLTRDVRKVRTYAMSTVEKLEGIRAGRASREVVFSAGRIDRERMLVGHAARLLLHAVHVDIDRLNAVHAAFSAEIAAMGPVRTLRQREVLEMAVRLTQEAIGLIQEAGMPPTAGPSERELMLETADRWLGHLEPLWPGARDPLMPYRWRLRRARRRDERNR